MVTYVERGIPRFTGDGKPEGPPEWESEPQGTLMDLRVRDDGESECRMVIVRIGVEPSATSLHTKVRRIPFGVSSRDRQIIHLDKGKQTMKGISL